MVQYIRLVCLVLMLLACIGSVAKAASFDCNKATTETEIAICADPELSALDELMGEIWGQTSQSSRAVNDQVRWLTERDALSNIWHLIEFYNYRIVGLITGCQPEDHLFEIFDDEFPYEELVKLRESSDRLEQCIDNHYQRIAKDFEAISYSLSVLPEDCVIGFDPFMYPISEPVGHSVYHRCSDSKITRYQILYEAMLELIAEQNSSSAAVLDADQRNWKAFSEASCGFFSGWGLHAIERVAPNHCRLKVLQFRLLYLSPWIGVEDNSGWPAGSIEELLGPSYGFK
jgi:uncharacterized protein YecT (DUF1311 family)